MGGPQQLVQAVVKRLVTGITRVYFSRIEVRGRRNLPAGNGAAIFAGNHPSGLVDPMVLMAAMPELAMSSVAKHSLFSTPVVSFFLKAMRAVPVAKAYDAGLAPDKQPSLAERRAMNAEMFATVEARLKADVSIVIFPEGTCHSTYEIKELKGGTARMALETAKDDGPRFPIIPIGLSYSSKSGERFRSKVLVDIGRPLIVSAEQIAEYSDGDASAAVASVTSQIERSLRHVTITAPNWAEELARLAAERGLHPPQYRLGAEDEAPLRSVSGGPARGPIMQRCLVEVGIGPSKDLFVSTGKLPPPQGYGASSSASASARIPAVLKNEAARAAYFSLSGAAGGAVESGTDWDLITVLHLARRLYKPDSAELSLAQYAAITRNFTTAAIRNLHDGEFQRLYVELQTYASRLAALKVSDKYVGMHAVGSDPLNERLQDLRAMARLDLLKTAAMAPLSVFGAVTHAPVAALAVLSGQRLGVNAENGDNSVEATMRIIAGFVTISILYPMAAGAAAWAAGSGLLFFPALVLLATSGHAAVTRPLWQDSVRASVGSIKLLWQKDSVDELRSIRIGLKGAIRDFADAHAEPALRGWWRDPDANTESIRQVLELHAATERQNRLIVTPAALAEAAMTSYRIELYSESKRHPDEAAVLTAKQWPGNRNALVWIPGRNDSFFHVHVLERILDAGFDVFALDMRRCGRAQFGPDGERTCAELLAHDSHDFREYFEEIDATLKFLKSPAQLPSSGLLRTGGSGKHYENVVLYGHSTGGLVATLYGAEYGGGWRGAIDGYIFNSPFLRWNVEMYQRVLLENAKALRVVDPAFVLSEGGHPSSYSALLHESYGFSPDLKNLKELSVTAGWCRAVTDVQTKLRKKELMLSKPTLVLSTAADTVLDHADITAAADNLSTMGDGALSPIRSSHLVERSIGSDAKHKSAHDVLAAPSPERVDEAMGHIGAWMSAQFPR